jgi:hypothetical protein
MENLPFRILVFSFLMLLGRTSEAQHTSANEIFGFNQKSKTVLEEIRKEVIALGEVDGFSEFAKNVSIKNVNGQDSYSSIQHSLIFEINTRDVMVPLPKDGNLTSLAGYSDVGKRGVELLVYITDRGMPLSEAWAKNISVAGEDVSVVYRLKLGSEISSAKVKIDGMIQEILTRDLLK